ncbi:granzyme B-like [Chanos chanos]|uniref:Granzyme B-like n=1 Tax=Chanos chanos TaxID=29144 RepID=A0A6J2WGJ8_CHACN|nr:granzyme B-like [Chanos chanos]
MYIHLFLLFCVLSLSGATESGIVGGKAAKPHSRPYMVSVWSERGHTCGGMLIREDFVMTAAHCLDRKGSTGSGRNHLKVVLGAHNIAKKEDSQQVIEVKKYYRHPKFGKNGPSDMNYDIMLLKLKTKAKLNKYVKVLALPKKNGKIPANVKCSIAGWGMKRPNGAESDVLYEVTLKVQSESVCKEKWGKWFDDVNMMCSVSDGKQAFCQGDSGGPLICNTSPVGIAIYTSKEKCTDTNFPEVYTKISTFLPWIHKMMRKKI